MTTHTDEWHPERIPAWLAKRLLKAFPQTPVPALALEQLANECNMTMRFQEGGSRWGAIKDTTFELFCWWFKALSYPQTTAINLFASRMEAHFIVTSGSYLGFPDRAGLCIATFSPKIREQAAFDELETN